MFKRVIYLHYNTVVGKKSHPVITWCSLLSLHVSASYCKTTATCFIHFARDVNNNISDYDSNDENINFSTQPGDVFMKNNHMMLKFTRWNWNREIEGSGS